DAAGGDHGSDAWQQHGHRYRHGATGGGRVDHQDRWGDDGECRRQHDLYDRGEQCRPLGGERRGVDRSGGGGADEDGGGVPERRGRGGLSGAGDAGVAGKRWGGGDHDAAFGRDGDLHHHGERDGGRRFGDQHGERDAAWRN